MPIATYLDQSALPYPFCPGCSHGLVLNHLNAALVELQLDPHQVVIVTDIGCSGLSDRYFITNAFHGLHGRSVTYAEGIKLANPALKVIVLMGDGGCGIGGHHLISAARRNIGVTVVVFNNLNFGMTGGQHSVTTPHGATTATTRAGNLERPLDVCATLAVNGAGFVARATAFDKELPELMTQAITYDGFSLIDAWELCTAYFVPNNDFSRKALEATLAEFGFPTGIIHREERPEYSRAYRDAHAGLRGRPTLAPTPLVPKYPNRVTRKLHCVVAGSAGGKVRSTAAAFSRGAVLAGLWATQRDDYPVTVMTGYSVSEVILGPEEIRYTGIPRPDLMLVLTPEGLHKVRRQIAGLAETASLYVNAALLPVETPAQVIPVDFGKASIRVTRSNQAVMALAAMLRHSELYPLAAFEEAIQAGQRAEVAEENLAAIRGSEGICDA
jgi:2-oxoglutarate ferredoxin oxidoreductase subunit beta